MLYLRGAEYRTRVIAWGLHYGEWPVGGIYSLNGDPEECRIQFLRESLNVTNYRDIPILTLRESLTVNEKGETFVNGEKCKTSSGRYIVASMFRLRFLAHVGVKATVDGAWPLELIDHVNGNGHDNRPENLRYATHKENAWNSKKRSNNTSGVKGV